MAHAESIELQECGDADGEFIRSLTRENFFEVMSRTVGWDEHRHLSEPVDPASYQLVYRGTERIGFLRERLEKDCLYLVTIQLLSHERGNGVGTYLLSLVEEHARGAEKACVRLRVFRENRASALYRRLGYTVVASDDHSLLMEKAVDRPTSSAP